MKKKIIYFDMYVILADIGAAIYAPCEFVNL
jgi:hypothetical protein